MTKLVSNKLDSTTLTTVELPGKNLIADAFIYRRFCLNFVPETERQAKKTTREVPMEKVKKLATLGILTKIVTQKWSFYDSV